MKLSRILFASAYSRPSDLMVFSPHLYPLTLWGTCRLFNADNSFCLRLPGILMWLATFGSISFLCRRTRPCLALFCCITLPLAVSAALIVEIDETIMPFMTLLLLASVEHWLHTSSWKDLALTSCWFCLALWCRLSTPIVLVPALLVYVWFKSHSVRILRDFIIALASGAALFAVSWYIYGRLTGVDWKQIYVYLFTSLKDTTAGERAAGLSRLIQNAAFTVFWGMNPYLLVLIIAAFWQTAQKCLANRSVPLKESNIYLWGGIWLLGCFGVVGGSLFGFPKYQTAAYPLLCLAVILHGCRHWEWTAPIARPWKYVLWGLSVAITSFFIVKDPIYTLRFSVRQAQFLNSSSNTILAGLAVRLAIVHGGILFLGLCMWRFLHGRPALLLLAAAIGVNGGLIAHQTLSKWQHGYVYGDGGDTRKVAMFIRENGIDTNRILVPHEVLEQFNDRKLTEQYPFLIGTPQELLQRLQDERPQCVATSWLVYPIPALRQLDEDKPLQNYLKSNYKVIDIENYRIWKINDN